MDDLTHAPKTNPLAIWSLVLGILSLLCCAFVTGIPAVICGHIARSRINQSRDAESGSGIALAGLILGYFGIFITTIGILASIAVPNFIMYRNKALCSNVESEAINTSAAVNCYLSDPSIASVPTVEDLSASDCGFTPSDNVTIQISGTLEEIIITANDNSGRCPMGSYYILTIPESPNDGWQP